MESAELSNLVENPFETPRSEANYSLQSIIEDLEQVNHKIEIPLLIGGVTLISSATFLVISNEIFNYNPTYLSKLFLFSAGTALVLNTAYCFIKGYVNDLRVEWKKQNKIISTIE